MKKILLLVVLILGWGLSSCAQKDDFTSTFNFSDPVETAQKAEGILILKVTSDCQETTTADGKLKFFFEVEVMDYIKHDLNFYIIKWVVETKVVQSSTASDLTKQIPKNNYYFIAGKYFSQTIEDSFYSGAELGIKLPSNYNPAVSLISQEANVLAIFLPYIEAYNSLLAH
ncbi:MAG: hypothetical protein LBV55_00010 [Acholeplasmatales bacterium]|jgi:thioredoxin-related protein|nr:hypothetical protein [Acholeplasmatales bacterium]